MWRVGDPCMQPQAHTEVQSKRLTVYIQPHHAPLPAPLYDIAMLRSCCCPAAGACPMILGITIQMGPRSLLGDERIVMPQSQHRRQLHSSHVAWGSPMAGKGMSEAGV